jgi:hypothetical protein
MSDLDYSVEAKNVINLFYRAEKLVYVEGVDDVPFWEFLFEKLSNISVEVVEVGGKDKLRKYAKEVADGTAEYLVAMDGDYDHFSLPFKHDNILRTYGYSIENSLISADTLNKLIRVIGKVPRRNIDEENTKQWLNHLADSIESLVAHDLVNAQDGLGIVIIPDNSDRFMESARSCALCPKSIQAYLAPISKNISEERLKSGCQEIAESGFSILEVVRGHFLFSAAMRFIRSTLKTVRPSLSISHEMFYANVMSAFENTFDHKHPHFGYYEYIFSQLK